MRSPAAAFPRPRPPAAFPVPASWRRCAAAARVLARAGCALALAGCATQPSPTPGRPGGAGRYFDPILGVWASPRLVEDGEAVPRGGGGYLVGRPYTIGGRVYVPNPNPQGYAAVGTASWYGDAFHGRRTANGEVFDKGSISAAHPTLPLPSYVRVTNLNNGRSMIVRVNDRGPYHGGRVMDVSQRVAEALAFKDEGTGRVRIEYVGRAEIAGSDDGRLLATLTTDGRPARLDGPADFVAAAGDALPPRPADPSPLPNISARVAALPIFHGPPPPASPALPGASAAPAPPPPPVPRLALSSPARPLVAVPSHRGMPVKDPFFRPLVPPPKPGPAPRSAVRRPGRPGSNDAAPRVPLTGVDGTR